MNTIPTVTKNLLIINVLMFLGTIVAQTATASTSPNIWDCIFSLPKISMQHN